MSQLLRAQPRDRRPLSRETEILLAQRAHQPPVPSWLSAQETHSLLAPLLSQPPQELPLLPLMMTLVYSERSGEGSLYAPGTVLGLCLR